VVDLCGRTTLALEAIDKRWVLIVVSMVLQVYNLQRFRRVRTGLRPFDPASCFSPRTLAIGRWDR
jgi:hypothetical protein